MITDFAYVELLVEDVELAKRHFKHCYGFEVCKLNSNDHDFNVTLKSNDITIHLTRRPIQDLGRELGCQVMEVGFYVKTLDHVIDNINNFHDQCVEVFDQIDISPEKITLKTKNKLKFSFLIASPPKENENLQKNKFQFSEIDHLAMCVPKDLMHVWSSVLSNVLDLEQCFEQKVTTQTSGMDSLVLRSRINKKVRVVFLEPLIQKSPCQLGRYLRINGGLGVQHIAFLTENIYVAAKIIESRGVDILKIPELFYEDISNVIDQYKLDKKSLSDNNIVFDIDSSGYLLQCFTESMFDSELTFIEIISRHNSDLFGAENIHILFKALELEVSSEVLQ